MAVDVYVMPLWRFKAGDFTTAVERLGGSTLVATRAGIMERVWSHSGLLKRWRARREVRSICRAVRAVNGGEIDWPDEGATIYANQFRSGDAIRAACWWLDRRDLIPRFAVPASSSDAQVFYSIARDRRPSWPHLSSNSYYNGYFLPVDFDVPVDVEPYKIAGWFPATRTTCSTIRALAEIEEISALVGLPREYRWSDDDPLATIRASFDHLRTILELSARERLPVIFYG